LPLGSIVRIENLDTGRSAVARVNDRGPFVEGRIVDCSFAVARELGFVTSGVATVRVTLLDSIGAAADFAGPAVAGLYLEDCAPPFIAPGGAAGTVEIASVNAPSAIPSIAALGPRPGVTMREASLLPFPALLHASRWVGDWFAVNRQRVALPRSVRLRLHHAGLRAFLRLFTV
jgi:hypothetical protein